MKVALSPFAQWFGMEIINSNASSAQLRLQVQEHHLNRFGSAHGGVCMSLADHCCGVLLSEAAGEDAFYATTNLHSSYFKGAHLGELNCTAQLVSRSKTIAHIRADVMQGGELVFQAVGNFAIRPKRVAKS